MTRDAIVPLESYRLAKYAIPMPCYICEEENSQDAEHCRSCMAPMALAHQAADPKTAPKMIAVMGASGAGKTVYLGMLMDMLSRLPTRMQLLARGAFSITLQQATMAALSRGVFPEKTPNEPDHWNWVHCQVRRPDQRDPVELIVPDMAGEAVLEEVNHPHSYRVIGSYFRKCCASMILIDTTKFKAGSRDQDYFVMKLISYLSELADDPKQTWKNRPVALVFTKTDECEECYDDPEGYAKSHATGFWQHCCERFANHRFFATRVAGTCVWRESYREGRIRVPLRIEPHGVIEPFEWLLEQILKKGRR